MKMSAFLTFFLQDFQNFQYTIARVNGVTINLRGKDTIINLPQHRYDEVGVALMTKVANSCSKSTILEECVLSVSQINKKRPERPNC